MLSVSAVMSPDTHQPPPCPSLSALPKASDWQAVTTQYAAAKRCRCPRCQIRVIGLWPLVYGSQRPVSVLRKPDSSGRTTIPPQSELSYLSGIVKAFLSSGRPGP